MIIMFPAPGVGSARDNRICSVLGWGGGAFQLVVVRKVGVWGGVPNVGGAASKMISKRQWGYEPHREGGRKINCWSGGNRLVQAVQFRFDCFPVQLARLNQNRDRLAGPV